MSSCPFSDALLELLPGAIITRRRAHEWHSASFSGRRVKLSLQIVGFEGTEKNFMPIGEDHEFSLPGLLVADLAFGKRNGNRLTVEALLLDEEI